MRRNQDNRIDLILLLVLAMLITALNPTAAGAHVAPMHTHRPAVRYTIFEQFGVTATQTYVKASVTQDNKPSIGNPVLTQIDCYHSNFPVWTTLQCLGSAWKVGSGASGYAQIQISAEFSHTTGVYYYQHSYYKKRANEGDTFYCGLAYGALPWFWDDHCYAYLDNVLVGDY